MNGRGARYAGANALGRRRGRSKKGEAKGLEGEGKRKEVSECIDFSREMIPGKKKEGEEWGRLRQGLLVVQSSPALTHNGQESVGGIFFLERLVWLEWLEGLEWFSDGHCP